MDKPYLFYPKDGEVRSPTSARKDKTIAPGLEQLNAVNSKLSLGNNLVNVVGIIGKSTFGKGSIINNLLLDRPVFQVIIFSSFLWVSSFFFQNLEFGFDDPDHQNSQSNQVLTKFSSNEKIQKFSFFLLLFLASPHFSTAWITTSLLSVLCFCSLFVFLSFVLISKSVALNFTMILNQTPSIWI